MLVSFIVIAYNEQNSLGNLLNNLFFQDYDHKKIEVILIDGISTDKTKLIMDEFAENHKSFRRITVHDNPKRTLPCGWNIALNEAEGDIILRVDAHASIPDNFVSKNVETIISGKDICGGKVISISKDLTIWQKTVNIVENSFFGGGIAKFRRSSTAGYVSTVAFAAYKKSIFDAVGLYDERFERTEDNIMHYRMKKAGYAFYYNPQIQSFRETRSTFLKLVNQKYSNGYWIGLTLRHYPKCFSLYHIIPFIFVMAILISLIIAFFGVWQFFVLLWIVYFISNLLISTITSLKTNFQITNLCLPILFLLIHIAYGFGILIGIYKSMILRV